VQLIVVIENLNFLSLILYNLKANLQMLVTANI